jgi:hypothetical protein
MDLDLLQAELESTEFLMLSGALTIDERARYCCLCVGEGELRALRGGHCVGVDAK